MQLFHSDKSLSDNTPGDFPVIFSFLFSYVPLRYDVLYRNRALTKILHHRFV